MQWFPVFCCWGLDCWSLQSYDIINMSMHCYRCFYYVVSSCIDAYILAELSTFSFTVVGRYVTWSFKFSCDDTICELKRQLEDFNESSKSMVLYLKLNDMSYYLPSCLPCVLPSHSLLCIYDIFISSLHLTLLLLLWQYVIWRKGN